VRAFQQMRSEQSGYRLLKRSGIELREVACQSLRGTPIGEKIQDFGRDGRGGHASARGIILKDQIAPMPVTNQMAGTPVKFGLSN